MDKLEKFIQQNKENLKATRKADTGWDIVQQELSIDEKPFNYGGLWKVAAVIFMASTFMLSVMVFSKSDSSNQIVGVESQGVESYYMSLIEYKTSEFKELSEVENEEFLAELAAFDQAYEELKESFKEYNNEELVQAMIENLRLRVLILNEQIEMLKNGDAYEEEYFSS